MEAESLWANFQINARYNFTIRVIGLYSHRGLAIVERFNKTLANFANAEWESGMENQKRATDPIWTLTLFTIRKIVLSEKPVLYYLDGEYVPSRRFVREEFMHVDPDKIQYPPQRITGLID